MGLRKGWLLKIGQGGSAPAPLTEAPAFTAAPSISGSATQGSTLTCDPGTVTGTPTPDLAYQWRRDGVNIIGAIASTYASQVADVGTDIDCVVTATNVAGSASEASSNAITVTAAAGPGESIWADIWEDIWAPGVWA